MAIREWCIESRTRHNVRVEHGWITGRVKVVVDGQLVYERLRKFVDCGFSHRFSIDDHMFVVSACTSLKCFSYSLKQLEPVDYIVDPVPIVLTYSKWLGDACFYGSASFLAFVVIVFVWSDLVATDLDRLKPRSNEISLKQFAATMPAPHGLAVVEDNDASKVVWIGETAALWSLPSGPACYVFDSNGTLVEWDASTGDGQPTTRFLERAFAQKQLTVDQALEFIAGRKSKSSEPVQK